MFEAGGDTGTIPPRADDVTASHGDAEAAQSRPQKLIADAVVEKAIREKLKKPTGELTNSDL